MLSRTIEPKCFGSGCKPEPAGKKAKTVVTEAKEVLEKSAPASSKQEEKRTITVRVVDIFGNDAGVVMEVS